MLELKYSKVWDVKSPEIGTSGSAGLDFFIPEFTEEFIEAFRSINHAIYIHPDRIILHPHDRVLIPSGIRVFIPSGHSLIMFNKSGVSTKRGLDVLACVIDEDYQGMIHLSLVNTSQYSLQIKPGEKIIQGILLPIPKYQLKETTFDSLYPNISERGAGGFGSTGN